MLTPESKIEKKVTNDLMSSVRDAVELNEKAIAKAAGEKGGNVPTLSRKQIDQMSIREMKGYFKSQAKPEVAEDADKAITSSLQMAGMTADAAGFVRAGVTAVGTALAAIACPPLLLGTLFSAGYGGHKALKITARLDSKEPSEFIKEGKNQREEVKAEAGKQLFDTAQSAKDRSAILKNREDLLNKMNSVSQDMKLEEAFKENNGWLLK